LKILISSRNRDKIKEITEILSPFCFEIVTVADFQNLPDIVEDKATLFGNSYKKANEIMKLTGITTIADDTGLFIDALNGEPGINSARYAGEKCSYQDNRNKVLQNMVNIKNRSARFITSIVLVQTNGRYINAEGVLEGTITEREIGSQGFGYDPIFIAANTNKTLSEISPQEKNRISHRGKALENLVVKMQNIFTYNNK